PTSPPFPYTTLFRSAVAGRPAKNPGRSATDKSQQIRRFLCLLSELYSQPQLRPPPVSIRQNIGRSPEGAGVDIGVRVGPGDAVRSEEHTSELQSPDH